MGQLPGSARVVASGLRGSGSGGRFVGAGGSFVLWGGRDRGAGRKMPSFEVNGAEDGWAEGEAARETRGAGGGGAAGCGHGVACVRGGEGGDRPCPAGHAGMAAYRYWGTCADLGSGDERAGGGAAAPGGHCRTGFRAGGGAAGAQRRRGSGCGGRSGCGGAFRWHAVAEGGAPVGTAVQPGFHDEAGDDLCGTVDAGAGLPLDDALLHYRTDQKWGAAG